jgi:S-adenosylmethionine:tRNA-ribosyltransferase-isomerase (queuine synthetase)
MQALANSSLSFDLPVALEAHEPPEARGLARDDVRLMASYFGDDAITHTRFTAFPGLLRPGDVLVVNESATVNASLSATRSNGEPIELHLSQRLSMHRWVVELRRLDGDRATRPLRDATTGEVVALPAGAQLRLIAPYGGHGVSGNARLWLASVTLPDDVDRFLDRHGSPIRYGYVERAWPLSYYQTIFAREPGSAEMPSAGRPFSARVLEGLARRGVRVAPIVLHTGVSSLEEHEPPYAEYFRVDESTARVVNDARRRGGRVVAVGTTAVRALETVAAPDGTVSPGSGWTNLIVTPERGIVAVDALLTGFHEPRASHLAMLQALAGREHVDSAYHAALGAKYLWHEFGDVHLLMPGRRLDN